MPIYLYTCEICSREDEVLQNLSAEAPDCCGKPMRKLPTYPVKVEIKGTYSEGYKKGYAKDYKRRLQEKKS